MEKHLRWVLTAVLSAVLVVVVLSVAELRRVSALDGWLVHGTNGENLVITRTETVVAVSGNRAVETLLNESENGTLVRLFYRTASDAGLQTVSAFGGFCYGKSNIDRLPQQPIIQQTESGLLDGLGKYEICTGWFWRTADAAYLLSEASRIPLTAANEAEKACLQEMRVGDAVRCVCRRNADGSRTLCFVRMLEKQESIPEALLKKASGTVR